MVLVLLCFIAVVAVLPVTQGLHWTADLPDGAVVHACKGGNLTLPWNVTMDSGERINNIQWFYDGASHEMMAMNFSGNFITLPAFSQRVELVGIAGIVLSHVTTSDAGSYRVQVAVNDAAEKSSTFSYSAFVDVAYEPPVSSDVNLHARQEPVVVYDQSTNEWRVALTCGTFTSLGQPPVNVTWRTPSGTTMSSTSYADGEFRLLLPNPVTGGTYTCHLPHDSPAAACLPMDSPILTPAAVDVDEVKARLSLIEVEQKALREENEQLEAANAGLQGDLKDLSEDLADANERINIMATGHVSFYARLFISTQASANTIIILPKIISNDGGAYSNTTGYFTAPYAGTYVFLATASIADPSHTADLYIKVDGSDVCYLIADENNRNTGSCQAVVHLMTGQRVWLASWGTGNYFYLLTTTFSGFLLNTD